MAQDKKISKIEALKILDRIEDTINFSAREIDLTRSEKKIILDVMGQTNKISGTIKIEYHIGQDDNEVVPEVTLKGTSAVKLLVEFLQKYKQDC